MNEEIKKAPPLFPTNLWGHTEADHCIWEYILPYLMGKIEYCERLGKEKTLWPGVLEEAMRIWFPLTKKEDMFDLETLIWTQNQSNNMKYRFQSNENSRMPRELNVIGMTFRLDYEERTKKLSLAG